MSYFQPFQNKESKNLFTIKITDSPYLIRIALHHSQCRIKQTNKLLLINLYVLIQLLKRIFIQTLDTKLIYHFSLLHFVCFNVFHQSSNLSNWIAKQKYKHLLDSHNGKKTAPPSHQPYTLSLPLDHHLPIYCVFDLTLIPQSQNMNQSQWKWRRL